MTDVHEVYVVVAAVKYEEGCFIDSIWLTESDAKKRASEWDAGGMAEEPDVIAMRIGEVAP